MWKNLSYPWPAVGVSAAFTAVVLGGYTYYVHAVMIPAEALAEQQRALAVQVRDAVVQRDVEAAGNAILNTIALMQTTQAMTPMAMAGSASDSGVAAAFGEPAAAVQPSTLSSVPASPPTMGYYADTAPPVSPPPPLYSPPPEPEQWTSAPASAEEAPGIVTVTVPPPPPLSETMPQVLTAGYYWEPGYWSYNQGRFNWARGQLKQKPAAFISGSSQYVPTQWVTRNGAYMLVPGYWVNQTNPYAGNTLPGAAPLIPAVAVAVSPRDGVGRGRGGGG